MRVRTAIHVLLAVGLAGVVSVQTAWAQEITGDESTTGTTLPEGSVSIGDGFAFTGAVITSPGEATPRTLDGHDAAVFVQAYLPGAIFGTPKLEDPPPELPVHRLDITGSWAYQPGMLTVYYATDGTTAWVGVPGDQKVRTEPGTPPAPSGWFVASERTIGAFEGTEELEPTAGVAAGTSTTTTPGSSSDPEEAADPTDSGSDTPWIIIGGVAIAVLVVGGLVLARRRQEPVAPTEE